MGGWLFAIRAGAAALGSSAIVGAARAEAIIGAPVPGQIGFLPANTIVQSDIEWFHNAILLPITIGISLLVLALLAYVVYRFNEQANPVASRTVHNTPLEIAWTVLPALILVVIAVPSFRLLSQQLIIPVPDMTLKVTAVQWHWNYGYPKSDGGFSFDSLIKDDKDLKPGDIRLLSVDNAAYVPVGKIVEVDVVSQDVIHSFSMPSFGIKIDAVPGRLNKTWFKADHEGVFYGQCSNICGIDHAFMPIEIHVVSQDAYQTWLEGARKQFARADGGHGHSLDAHVVDAAIDYGAHGRGDSGGDVGFGVGGLGSHPVWCDLTRHYFVIRSGVRGAAPQCFGKPFYYFRPF